METSAAVLSHNPTSVYDMIGPLRSAEVSTEEKEQVIQDIIASNIDEKKLFTLYRSLQYEHVEPTIILPLLTKAADLGHPAALCLLGSFYYDGKGGGVKQDRVRAEELLSKGLIDRGEASRVAMRSDVRRLALCRMETKGNIESIEKGIEDLSKEAVEGIPAAEDTMKEINQICLSVVTDKDTDLADSLQRIDTLIQNPIVQDKSSGQSGATAAKQYGNLKTGRGLIKFLLFNLITADIYTLYYFTTISMDINKIASRYDGKKTMNFLLVAFIFTPLTLGIVPVVWFHRISKRIGEENNRRRTGYYKFGASTYWLWFVLGSLILVGPFVYIAKLSKAMNLICADYNVRG